MKHEILEAGKPKRRSVNLSLDTGIVAAAREAGLNLSQISEDAIRRATKVEQERRWREQNRPAVDAWSRWYEQNGHPLERYKAW
ncbi:MAG: post-segregation antitoxin CcdA [Sphingomonas sp.]|uniref:type II toxin-antitoxin system CcdA family antitoxin n=2 Tax=Sphingomonas TaxID=13687 RepID=UPI000DBC0AAD|nr:type II toxin-antitoxin system CcdA family antitoxin [Sphingomonas sp.]PZU80089.1 MAG: post-segregation antitoxin CcdA [Sphingomonas sp.]